MDLRKNRFTVEIYENNMVRLGQKEADMVARLMQQATARTFINALVGAASAANCLKTLDSCLRRSDVGYC